MDKTQPFQQSIHHQMKKAEAGTGNILIIETVIEEYRESR